MRLVIAFLSWNTLTEPVTTNRYKLACFPIEDSDQAAHPRSLIRVFDGRFMGSQGSNVSSGGKLRLWSDCADAQTCFNLRCMHMPTCTLSWRQAHFLLASYGAQLTYGQLMFLRLSFFVFIYKYSFILSWLTVYYCPWTLVSFSCLILVSWSIDWLLSIKNFFANVWYHKLVASLTLMSLFYA